MLKQLSLLTLLLLTKAAHAQSDLTLKTRAYRQQHEHQLLDEFRGLLAIPNVVYDTVNIRRTGAYIADMLRKRGIEPRLLDAKTPGVPPAVYGEVRVPGAKQTVIFYAHYDGQPVNPNQWADGLKPFEPSLYTQTLDAGGQPRLHFPNRGTP